jgi:hypothetical protein
MFSKLPSQDLFWLFCLLRPRIELGSVHFQRCLSDFVNLINVLKFYNLLNIKLYLETKLYINGGFLTKLGLKDL